MALGTARTAFLRAAHVKSSGLACIQRGDRKAASEDAHMLHLFFFGTKLGGPLLMAVAARSALRVTTIAFASPSASAA